MEIESHKRGIRIVKIHKKEKKDRWQLKVINGESELSKDLSKCIKWKKKIDGG